MTTMHGLQVRHGNVSVLTVTDKTGIVAGRHKLEFKRGERFIKTFSHPELSGMGELFYWFSFMGIWEAEAKGSITISGTDIKVDVTVSAGNSLSTFGDGYLYYGVR